MQGNAYLATIFISMTMNRFLFNSLFLFAITLISTQGLFAQQKKSISNQDASMSVKALEKGTQKVPRVMGGGEAPSNSLMIVSPSWRGGKEVTPKTLGVDNLIPARWLDKEHFLFLGTDAVDIQDYFIYFSDQDKVYKCEFDIGEKIGYGEFDENASFVFTIKNEIITDFIVK